MSYRLLSNAKLVLVSALIALAITLFLPNRLKHSVMTTILKLFQQSFKNTTFSSSSSTSLEIEKWQAKQKEERSKAHKWMKLRSKNLIDNLKSSGFQEIETLFGKASLAQVVMWPRSLYSHVVWIYSKEPAHLQSPVVSGDKLLGHIDFVMKNYARVRLIQDPLSRVSVAVLRKSFPMQQLYEQLKLAQVEFECIKDSPSKVLGLQKIEELKSFLVEKSLASNSPQDTICSRGLLFGQGGGSFSKFSRLKGQGFNDLYLPSPSHCQGSKPLVEVGDELITSGLDGRFPFGLRVAKVASLQLQDEAGTLYDLEAETLITPPELNYVWILPPLGLDLVSND